MVSYLWNFRHHLVRYSWYNYCTYLNPLRQPGVVLTSSHLSFSLLLWTIALLSRVICSMFQEFHPPKWQWTSKNRTPMWMDPPHSAVSYQNDLRLVVAHHQLAKSHGYFGYPPLGDRLPELAAAKQLRVHLLSARRVKSTWPMVTGSRVLMLWKSQQIRENIFLNKNCQTPWMSDILLPLRSFFATPIHCLVVSTMPTVESPDHEKTGGFLICWKAHFQNGRQVVVVNNR